MKTPEKVCLWYACGSSLRDQAGNSTGKSGMPERCLLKYCTGWKEDCENKLYINDYKEKTYGKK